MDLDVQPTAFCAKGAGTIQEMPSDRTAAAQEMRGQYMLHLKGANSEREFHPKKRLKKMNLTLTLSYTS